MPLAGKRKTPGSSAVHPSFLRRSTPSLTPAITRTTSRTNTGTARTRTATRAQTATGEDAFIVAVIDNSMRDVGFCAYNLHGLDVELRHFPDSNNFATLLTVLTVFSPVEILFSLSSAGALLDQAIQACPYLTHIKRTFIGRTYFNETYGALMAEKLSYQPCPNLTRLGESSCYLALACCGALIRYVEHVEDLSFAPSTLRIRFRPNDDTVFLDVPTLEGLEVLTNARPGNGMAGRAANASLLRIMDKTKTRAGKRFLRRSLLEPCAHLGTISTRQDAVEELGNCEDMYFALSSVLSRFPDLERAMSALMARENARLRSVGSTNELTKKESTPGDESEDSLEEDVLSCHATRTKCGLKCQPPSIFLIQNILTIKAGLEAVQPMLHAIHKSKCSLLQAVAESLRSSSLSCLYESIVDVIEKDALPAKEAGRMRMQGAFAVKAGRNGRLDVSRKTLNENIEDMKTLTEELRKKYGLHKLELSMYVKRGYHFSIHKKFLPVKDLPNEFNQIDEGKKVHRFSSDELNQLNSRYHDSLEEIWRLTEIELGMLLNKIFDQKILTAVYRLCDSTAILDCLNSFVTYSSLCQTNTERPKLTQCGPIALHGAYHPTLLDVKAQGTVPNDVFLDETCGLHIISGRNQSGKSTFIRTVGLICVMAHTGCTVPAKFACVRMLGRIATRFNTGDDISQSQSHFSKEMNDIASIFDSIRENGKAHKSLKTTSRNEKCCSTKVSSTLVLVDELGRATSTLDGFAIACAVIEALAACPNVLTLFTTHFLGLAFAATVNPTIKDFHMSTSSKPADRSQTADGGNTDLGRTRFNYTIVNGILSERNYGIETARMAGFPQHIAVEALKLREILPVRRITVASDFAERHLKLEKSEKDNFRKSSSIVSIAQRINLIQASTTDPMELRRLLQQLQTRVKAAHHRSSSRGMRAPRSDGSLTEKEVVTSTPVLNASESNVETPETK